VFAFAAGTFIYTNSAAAASAAEIDRDVKSALEKLYAEPASAKLFFYTCRRITARKPALTKDQVLEMFKM
jgi:hypothetical protein